MGSIDEMSLLSALVVLSAVHIIYLLVYFQLLVSTNGVWLNRFTILSQTWICLYLIVRFNPYRKIRNITETEAKIIFSSSLFLLTNMGVIEFTKSFFKIGKEFGL